MQELTTTRHNPFIDPFTSVWGWEIPVYLFLGGLVAGLMIITGYFILKGKHKNPDSIVHYVPFLSIIFLTIGMFTLFLDLNHKLFVWRLYTTFQITSPMSWGSWILLLVYPALIANILIDPPQILINTFNVVSKWSRVINSKESFMNNIGFLNIIFGILLGVYTGVLLSTMGARPLWNSSVLWLLFLVSGLSTAAAFGHMVAKDVDEREFLAKSDNIFLISEFVVIILMLVGLMSSSQAHIQSAQLLLGGPFTAPFWVFVVGMGIIVPLFIQLLAVNHKIKHTPVAPLLVITGGLVLRFVIVYAGQFSHYINAHFQ
ncbi:MAG: polysulfide reductase NrfD [Ignavibacteriaceae bacterium]|nr:polysulfide reductase NrfD [Ignavibacteriaceae bacterium]